MAEARVRAGKRALVAHYRQRRISTRRQCARRGLRAAALDPYVAILHAGLSSFAMSPRGSGLHLTLYAVCVGGAPPGALYVRNVSDVAAQTQLGSSVASNVSVATSWAYEVKIQK